VKNDHTVRVSFAELEARLRRSQLFRGQPGELITRLSEVSHCERYRAGEQLWRAGELAVHFTIVQSGLLTLTRVTPSKEESLLGFFGPNESIGLTAVLEKGPYPASAAAISDEAEVLLVRASRVHEELRTSASLGLAMTEGLLAHTNVLRTKIDIMAAGGVPRRLAALFKVLVDRFGEPAEGGSAIPVVLSRAQLASIVSARVETIIRVMSRWSKEGRLRSTPNGFWLAPGALAEDPSDD
jgi:CRP-like cAMP-binding protein